MIGRRANVPNAGACGARDSKQDRFRLEILPADGIRLPIFGNGPFGASPFFGQL